MAQLVSIFLDVLTPVFALVVLGYVVGPRLGLEGRTLSRFAYYLLTPAFVFNVLSSARIEAALAQLGAEHEPRRPVCEHERAVGKLVQLRLVKAPPLCVKHLVELASARGAREREEALVVRVPAFGTRPVPGRERNRFVVEEQKRVVPRPPLLLMAPLELQGARDPEIARMKPHDLPPAMEDPPIPRPRPPQRNRHDVARRRDAVPGRTHQSSGTTAVATSSTRAAVS